MKTIHHGKKYEVGGSIGVILALYVRTVLQLISQVGQPEHNPESEISLLLSSYCTTYSLHTVPKIMEIYAKRSIQSRIEQMHPFTSTVQELAQKTDWYRCICSNRDMLGFYAGILIIFGVVYLILFCSLLETNSSQCQLLTASFTWSNFIIVRPRAVDLDPYGSAFILPPGSSSRRDKSSNKNRKKARKSQIL